jgi:biopolymer transport protein ExbB
MPVLEIFRSGGPIMWPLALCSLVALAIIIERSINLRRAKVLDPAIVERVTGLAEGGAPEKALEICRERPGIYTNIIRSGLEMASRGEGHPVAKEAMVDAGRHETTRLHRYVGVLGTIVGISPLLGLLGTVTGMIDVFNTIAEAGTGQASELSSGISQALITTATGLLIAIPSLVAYNFFREKAESIVGKLERESLRVLAGLYHVPQSSIEESTLEPAKTLLPHPQADLTRPDR